MLSASTPARSTISLIADSIFSPRTSILIMPASSKLSLSHWTTVRSGMVAGSVGKRRESGTSAIISPPLCMPIWRTLPSKRSQIWKKGSKCGCGLSFHSCLLACLSSRAEPSLGVRGGSLFAAAVRTSHWSFRKGRLDGASPQALATSRITLRWR